MGKPTTIDLWIIGPIIILQLFSIIILRSVIPGEIGKHLIVSLAALGAYGLMSQIDYRTYIPLAKFLYILSIVLLIATFVFGEPTRGSTRWINVGSFTIQPSEFIKPLMIVALSSIAHTLELRRLTHSLIYFLLLLLPVTLIFLQPDLGSAIILTVIGVAIAFFAGTQYRVFISTIAIFLVSFPLIVNLLKPYQKDRIEVFLNPFSDPLGSGYSVIQSMIAVGSGKLFGRGLGHGTQSQLQFLPERHSDFIFASIAEELGFMGVMMVLASYIVLLNYLLKIAKDSQDTIGSLIVIGVFSMLLFQVVINIGMNLGLLPVTGITLPLISSGGSSLLTTLISLGLVQSISRRKKRIETIEIQ